MSADRILTTHVGSLPRSAAVVEQLTRREQGEPYDPATFRHTMAEAVDAHVARQKAVGIDIPSDGETSKISYATYVKDRLSGFAGDQARQVALDLADFPEFRSRMQVFAGKQSFKNDATGNIRQIFGRLSFEEAKLKENLTVLVEMIKKLKPASAKGIYVKSATIAPTMGPGIQVDLNS